MTWDKGVDRRRRILSLARKMLLFEQCWEKDEHPQEMSAHKEVREARNRGRAMSTSDYRTLIDRGRKAGLRTAELYQAIVTHRPEGSESAGGQADCNGFISCFDTNGHRVYRPVGGSDRG
jgi:hypothetical protein